jgi:cytochrome c553
MKSLILMLIMVVTASLQAKADTDEAMISAMNKKLSDMSLLNESIIRGGLRVRLCQYCHGKDGNSLKGNIPNLAQQNPIYLLTQFEAFRNGTRKNKVMNELAKGLTEEERINIALYYASQNVSTDKNPVNINSGLYSRGADIYKKTCVACHGEKGYGLHSLPRIAGQKHDFITATLAAYKDQKGVRPDSPMVPVSRALSENDIMAIATFVSLMP